ncbi:MAG: PspC domain-containing protein, partial [Acidimicrobiia bacterium]
MTTDTQPSEAPPPPGPLVRPLERRVVVGVAAALSDRLGIPLLLIRIAFALLTVVGGLGLFLYLAGWLLIRGEGEAEIPAVRLGRRIGTAQGWIGVALVALAAIIILDNTTFFRGSLLWAVVLLVVGVLLYRGDLGRIGTRPAPPPEVEGPPEGSAPAVPTGPAPESPAGHPGSLVVEGGGFPPPPPMADSYPPGPAAPPRRSGLGR